MLAGEVQKPGGYPVFGPTSVINAVALAGGTELELRLSTPLPDGRWVVELRRPDNSGPDLGVEPGTVLTLPGGGAPLETRSAGAGPSCMESWRRRQ